MKKMKKIIALIMTALMALLCGCGMSQDANSTVYDGTGTDDGFVYDADGYIGDHDSTAYPSPTPATDGVSGSGTSSNDYHSGADDTDSSSSDHTGSTGSAVTTTPQPSPQTAPQAK